MLQHDKQQHTHQLHTDNRERYVHLYHAKLREKHARLSEEERSATQRASLRSLHHRWRVIVHMSARLSQFAHTLATRRYYLRLNARREWSARVLQRAWRAYRVRVRDSTRQRAFAVLAKFFKILFLRARLRRRKCNTALHHLHVC